MHRTVEFDKIPGSKRLFLDFLSGRTGAYYHYHFASDQALDEIRNRLSEKDFQREQIVEALERQNKIYQAGAKTFENIRKLLDPATTAVFTGQQVTLFGGPLYTFYKACLAVKLAATNCRKLQSEVVPIFWLASDDADFTEVAQVTVPGRDDRLAKLRYEPGQEIVGQPMSSLRLDQGINDLLDQYEQALPETEFVAELISKLRECYQPGESIVTVFGKYLSFLFHDHGLILVDPSDPVFRQLAIPIFKKELQLREEAASLVEKNNRLLSEQGYHLQVAKPGHYANLFYYNGTRARVNFAANGFEIDGRFVPQAELERMVDDNPSLFSPNVFLRPIVQSYVFPTLIYFAGPAEVAYFGQIKELFDLFNVVPPVIYPRFSATIVEKSIGRLLEKYELVYEDFLEDIGKLASDVLWRSFPDHFVQQLQSLREEVKGRLLQINRGLDQNDHGLITYATKAATKIDFELQQMEDKVFQAHRKKNQTIRAQLSRMASHLMPEGELQERVFPLNYYIAKYGFGIVDRLLEATDCNTRVHHLIYLDQPPKET